MSDKYAEQVQAEQPVGQTPAGPRSFTLLITLQPNGSDVEVSGPIGNDGLCYLMLEKTRAHIQNLHFMAWVKRQEKTANGQGIAGLLKKMGRG